MCLLYSMHFDVATLLNQVGECSGNSLLTSFEESDIK